MKSTYLSHYLVGVLFILIAGCSQPKAGKKHPNQRQNTQTNGANSGNNTNTNTTSSTSSSSGSTTAPSNTPTNNPSSSNTGTPSNVNKSSLPKNWPWRGICFQSENSDASDVAYLASIGVNFLRIQMKPVIRAKRTNEDPKKCFYDELIWAESILDECKKHGMTSLVAFNHLVLDPKIKVDEKSQEFWDDQRYIDSTYSMINIIVSRFKNRGDELAAYEVMGEPVIQKKGGGITPPQLENFLRNVLLTIRKVDKDRWFLLSPGPWGRPTNYAGFEGFNIQDSRVIYNAHMYLPDPFTHQGIRSRPKGVQYPGKVKGEYWDRKTVEEKLSILKRFQKKHNCLVYIGEFQAARWSKGSEIWVKDVLEVSDSFQWSWSLFAYEAGTEAWDPYYDVANKNLPAEQWDIKKVGPTTPLWKYMISEFEKNKK